MKMDEIVVEKHNRISWLDIARGIAMLSIVAGHLGVFGINRIVFTYHLPIFFLISGYFINRKQPYKEFVKGKIWSLIIPYLFTWFCFCVVSIPVAVFQHMDWKASLCHWLEAGFYGAGINLKVPFIIPGIGAIWFFLATFWAEIILRKLLDTNNHGIVITGVIIFFTLSIITKKYFWLPFSIQAGGPAIAYMYIGYLLNIFQPVIKKYSNMVSKIIMTIICSVFWFHFIYTFTSYGLVYCDTGKPYFFPESLCACYVLMQISKLISMLNLDIRRLMIFTGIHSALFLSVHAVELELYPWSNLFNLIPVSSVKLQTIIIFGMKLIYIYILMAILIHIPFIRKIFKYKKPKVNAIILRHHNN